MTINSTRNHILLGTGTNYKTQQRSQGRHGGRMAASRVLPSLFTVQQRLHYFLWGLLLSVLPHQGLQGGSLEIFNQLCGNNSSHLSDVQSQSAEPAWSSSQAASRDCKDVVSSPAACLSFCGYWIPVKSQQKVQSYPNFTSESEVKPADCMDTLPTLRIRVKAEQTLQTINVESSVFRADLS